MPALTLTPDEIGDAIARQPLPPTGLGVDVDLVDGGVRLDLTAGPANVCPSRLPAPTRADRSPRHGAYSS